MQTEIQKKLHELALKRSIPFCYNDYIECPDGVCPKCGSDDLMRLLPEVGCEYGTDWIIKHILETELEPIDMDEAFEEHVRQCYPESIDIGWLRDYDLVSAYPLQYPHLFKFLNLCNRQWDENSIKTSWSTVLGTTHFRMEAVRRVGRPVL